MRTLSALSVGESGIIKEVNPESPLYYRFLDLGFVPDTNIECVLKSPLGDPCAYSARGALIAIRQEDASDIIII